MRPIEIDGFKDPSLWKVVIEGDKKVLWVYQTKLTAIPRDHRWKQIPILLPEQEEGLDIIQGGNFKSPLVKTLRKYLGPRIDCYAGRKGFERLMIEEKKYALETVSAWMGHQSIDTTWRKYRDRRVARFKKA